MRKSLFFMAPFLVPVLACAANPSANLSVQVIPASNGTQCAVYGTAPSTPHLATAMGFTTCVLYVDFTKITNAQLQQLVACVGNPNTSTPFQLQLPYTGREAPCSYMNLITDSACNCQVLDVTLPKSEGTNGVAYINLNSTGFSLPVGSFEEATWKVAANTYANNALESFAEVGSFYNYGFTSHGNIGMDQLEIYCQPSSIGCTISGSIAQNNTNFAGGQAPASACCYPAFTALDMSIYHKMSSLNTTDGSTEAAICTYIDGQAPSPQARGQCAVGNGTGYDATILAARMDMNVLSTGTFSTNFAPNMRGPYDNYMQNLSVWACSSWATSACPTPVQTTPPAY